MNEKELVKLFVASYLHSQGNATLQSIIFAYARIRLGQQYFRRQLINGARQRARILVSNAYEKRRAIYDSGHTSEQHTVELDFAKEWNRYMRELFADHPDFADDRLDDLHVIIVSRDENFIRMGRPFSFLIHYGVQRHSTGVPILDELYAHVTHRASEQELRQLSINHKSPLLRAGSRKLKEERHG